MTSVSLMAFPRTITVGRKWNNKETSSAAALWYCVVVVLMALVLLSSGALDINHLRADSGRDEYKKNGSEGGMMIGPPSPCDEIYVVGEGETLHTISDKCGDPFIVEENPHINDPDDVFPGLVIRITPAVKRK